MAPNGPNGSNDPNDPNGANGANKMTTRMTMNIRHPTRYSGIFAYPSRSFPQVSVEEPVDEPNGSNGSNGWTVDSTDVTNVTTRGLPPPDDFEMTDSDGTGPEDRLRGSSSKLTVYETRRKKTDWVQRLEVFLQSSRILLRTDHCPGPRLLPSSHSTSLHLPTDESQTGEEKQFHLT